MASLASRLADFAGRVRDQFNLIAPRLLPSGGAAGSYLAKASATDYALAWIRPPVRFGFFCDGQPTSTEKFGPWVADTDGTLPANLSGSIANSGAAYNAAASWILTKNGTSVGTVSFAAAATVATFATSNSAAVAFLRGDRFHLVPPSAVDSAAKDIGFTFVGTR